MPKKKKTTIKRPLIRRTKDALQFFYHEYTILAIGSVLAVATVTFFAILPPSSAILALGFSTIGSYLAYERKRRAMWERYTSFKSLQSAGKVDFQRSHEPINVSKKDLQNAASSQSHYSRRSDSLAISEDIILDDRDLKTIKPISHPKQHDAQNNAKMPASYNEEIIHEFLADAVRKKQITVHQQPIMEIPKYRAHFYKLRAEIETYEDVRLTQDDYQNIAEKYNIDGQILTLLLNHTIHKIEEGSSLTYIIPIKSRILRHPTFMNSLLAYHKSHPKQGKHIVLSMHVSEFEAAHAKEIATMRQLGRLDTRFMIRDVDDTALDIELLQSLNVRMLSMTAQFVSEKIATSEGFHSMIAKRRNLESNAFRVVIDGIDSEKMLRDFNDFAPRYAQGPLFSESEARAKTNQPLIYE